MKPDYRKERQIKFRKMIAMEAAQLMYDRTETEYFTAKRKIAKQHGTNHRPQDLPSNAEIRQQILNIADLNEGSQRYQKLKDMRLYALWMMKELSQFDPHLIGSTLTGHIRKGSDIDLHVFSDSIASVTSILDNNHLPYEIERKHIVKYGQERTFTHIHIHGRYEIEITLYAKNLIGYRFKSSITGKTMEKASIQELEKLMAKEYQTTNLSEELQQYADSTECYEMFKLLLLPLETVPGGPYHPEGDILYHSLQVFDLAKQGHGYDIEFLQAALLHDVGKGIDPLHHAEAGADALEGFVTERVLFLIRHHIDAIKYKMGELGHRLRVFLKNSEYFEDLMELRKLDDKGRESGVIAPTLEEALDYLRSIENQNLGSTTF